MRVGRAQNHLKEEHIKQIYEWYCSNEDVENYTKVVSMEEIKENEYNLNKPLYVEKIIEDNLPSLEEALSDLKIAWNDSLEAENKFKDFLREFIS